jgi:hypothetical protein
MEANPHWAFTACRTGQALAMAAAEDLVDMAERGF